MNRKEMVFLFALFWKKYLDDAVTIQKAKDSLVSYYRPE